jgi:hypothetical protein
MSLSEEAKAVIAAAPKFELLIEAWFARHFHNSIVSRDTELFNHVHAAKEDLKRVLSSEN